MEKVYVMPLDTLVQSGLEKVLRDLGGTVVIADLNGSFSPEAYGAGCEVVAVLLCEETKHMNGQRLFPGKHLRRLASFDAAQERGFPIHPTLTKFLSGHSVTVLAIRTPSTKGLLAPLTQRFVTAVEHFHHRDCNGAWHGRKTQRESRWAILAERRAERRMEFLPL